MSVQTQIDRISGNVTAALAAIAEKGVDVPDGSKSDALASLIAAIEAGGGGTSGGDIEFVPAATGEHTISVEIPDEVRAVCIIRTNDYPSFSPSGDGTNNTDKGETPFCAVLIETGWQTYKLQNRISVFNNSNTSYSASSSMTNSILSSGTAVDGNHPCVIRMKTNKNERLVLFVSDAGARGLRVGAKYRIVVL